MFRLNKVFETFDLLLAIWIPKRGGSRNNLQQDLVHRSVEFEGLRFDSS